MQVTNNSQVQLQAYAAQQQQTQASTTQTASSTTLQSDTVSFSSDAMAANEAELQRGGGTVLLPPGAGKKEN